MRLPTAALAFALMSGAAHGEAAPPQPAQAGKVSYPEAIRCQAFYVIYASLLERGSSEYKLAAAVFDEWDSFTASAYPGFVKDRDGDLFGEVARIDGELGQAADQAAAEKIMAGYMDACAAIEPFAA